MEIKEIEFVQNTTHGIDGLTPKSDMKNHNNQTSCDTELANKDRAQEEKNDANQNKSQTGTTDKQKESKSSNEEQQESEIAKKHNSQQNAHEKTKNNNSMRIPPYLREDPDLVRIYEIPTVRRRRFVVRYDVKIGVQPSERPYEEAHQRCMQFITWLKEANENCILIPYQRTHSSMPIISNIEDSPTKAFDMRKYFSGIRPNKQGKPIYAKIWLAHDKDPEELREEMNFFT